MMNDEVEITQIMQLTEKLYSDLAGAPTIRGVCAICAVLYGVVMDSKNKEALVDLIQENLKLICEDIPKKLH